MRYLYLFVFFALVYAIWRWMCVLYQTYVLRFAMTRYGDYPYFQYGGRCYTK